MDKEKDQVLACYVVTSHAKKEDIEVKVNKVFAEDGVYFKHNLFLD
jgi:hypothetical protein